MAEEPLNMFEQTCSRIKDAIPSETQWRWELQFRTVLAVLRGDFIEDLENLLANEFQDKWDYLSIENASDVMYRSFTDSLGIIPGQHVYSRETGELILFAALWPWGEKDLHSFRIGLISKNDLLYGDWAIRKMLRNWFNPKEREDESEPWLQF